MVKNGFQFLQLHYAGIGSHVLYANYMLEDLKETGDKPWDMTLLYGNHLKLSSHRIKDCGDV